MKFKDESDIGLLLIRNDKNDIKPNTIKTQKVISTRGRAQIGYNKISKNKAKLPLEDYQGIICN